VTEHLLAVAVALLARLGFPWCPLADTGPVLPVAVPLMAGGAAWLPLRPLGLPGEYTPTKGGAP
jgi:hypothetical protein